MHNTPGYHREAYGGGCGTTNQGNTCKEKTRKSFTVSGSQSLRSSDSLFLYFMGKKTKSQKGEHRASKR